MYTLEQKEQLQQTLEGKISSVQKQVAELKKLTQPIAPENAIGRVSRMDAINNRSVNEAALRKTQDRLKNMKFNLSNLHKKEFGACSRCGQTIQFERLLYMPESHTCTPCARRR